MAIIPTQNTTHKRFWYSTMPGFSAAAVMILVKIVEWLGSYSFAFLGLRPREIKGLTGILFFPFLHGDGWHLLSNLFPFVFLSTLVYNLVPKIFWKVYGLTFFLSGFWTWCFARSGLVIGASGWVYALLGFLLIAGFSRMGRRAMVIAGGLAFLYGGMVQGLLPFQSHISWEGHLMGFLSGTLAAIYWRKEIKETDVKPVIPSPIETEPPYPYWMFPVPHVVDSRKNVIHPNDLIWENGRPRLKTEEEKWREENPTEVEESEPHKPSGGFTDGYWTWHSTR